MRTLQESIGDLFDSDLIRLDEDLVNEVVEGYITSALWTTPIPNEQGDDSDGYLLDDYGSEDLGQGELDKVKETVRDFLKSNLVDVEEYLTHFDADHLGHDFWLTRNGHGAGFWDRGLGDLGRRLTDNCKPYGAVYLYIGDDGLLHGLD